MNPIAMFIRTTSHALATVFGGQPRRQRDFEIIMLANYSQALKTCGYWNEESEQTIGQIKKDLDLTEESI